MMTEEQEDVVFDNAHLIGKQARSPSPERDMTLYRRRQCPASNRRRVARTWCLCAAYLCLGLAIAIPGPTLSYLQDRVGVDTDKIGYVYTSRSLGYLIGSIGGGFLFDRFGREDLMFGSGLFINAIGLAVAPWTSNLLLLCFLLAFTGVAMGFLDTGGNVLCLRLWGSSSAPYIQALHFSFSVGAFIAALLAAPFLNAQLASLAVRGPGLTTVVADSRLGTAIANAHALAMHKRALDDGFAPDPVLLMSNESSQQPDLQTTALQPDLQTAELTVATPMTTSLAPPPLKPSKTIGGLLAQDNNVASGKDLGVQIGQSKKADPVQAPPSLVTAATVPPIAVPTGITVTSSSVTNVSDTAYTPSPAVSDASSELLPSTPLTAVAGTAPVLHDVSMMASDLPPIASWDTPSTESSSASSTTAALNGPSVATLDAQSIAASSVLPTPSSSTLTWLSGSGSNSSAASGSEGTSGALAYNRSGTVTNDNTTLLNETKTLLGETKQQTYNTADTVLNETTQNHITTQTYNMTDPEVNEITLNHTTIQAYNATDPEVNATTQDYTTTKTYNVTEAEVSETMQDHTTTQTYNATEPEVSVTTQDYTTTKIYVTEAEVSETTQDHTTTQAYNMTEPEVNETTQDHTSIQAYIVTDPEHETVQEKSSTQANTMTDAAQYGNETRLNESMATVISNSLTNSSAGASTNGKGSATYLVASTATGAPSTKVEYESTLPAVSSPPSSSNESSIVGLTTPPAADRYKFNSYLDSVQFVYLVLAALLLAVALGFSYFAFTSERENDARRGGKVADSNDSSAGYLPSRGGDIRFLSRILALMFVMCMLYVGTEVAFGQFISTFAMRHSHFNERQGALLTAVFWGLFVLGRGVSIAASRACSSTTLLSAGFAASAVALLALSFLMETAGGHIVLWVASGLLGLGLAPIFPTGFSWAEQYLDVSGKVASVFVVGSALGEMAMPAVVGHLIALAPAPVYMMYALLSAVLGSCAIYALAVYLATSTTGTGGCREHYTAVVLNGQTVDDDEERQHVGARILTKRNTGHKKVSFRLLDDDSDKDI